MLRKALPALWLAAAAVFGSAVEAEAQRREHPEHTYGFRCAYDSVQQDQFRRNPGQEQEYKNFLRRVAEMTPAEQARLNALPDVRVPVVFHVIHNGGTSNISDAQVLDALRIINRDFNKENPDTANIDSRFVALASRPGFKFVLAQKDPNGNCTTGITHTYSTQTLVGDNNVKNVIRWDTNRYLNIWVCERANGAGGYAFLPCTGGSLNDGIVITNTQFGSIGRSCRSNFCVRSLTHEVGHYFGLPHTWGGSNTPGLASNCGIDDGIADTPNTVGASQNCDLNEATCGPVANTENYMDYATCAKMFTIGQRTVMRASLALACRSTLVSVANQIATGTNDGYQAPSCAPVAAFSVASSVICPGGSVDFVDGSYGDLGTVNYAWSFPGGSPSSATTQNVTVTYATPGTYNATLTITGTTGTSTVTQQQIVRVLGTNAAIPATYAQPFEDDTWAANPTDADKNWRNEAAPGGTERWTRVTNVNGPSQTGNAALRLRPANISPGAVTTLYSPLINLAAAGSVTDNQVSFDYAYARLTSTSSDALRVAFSTDCGVTWTSNLNIATGILVSNTGATPVTGSFVPTASEWRTRTLSVPAAMQAAPRLLVRIEHVAGGGNNLFIDNFRAASATATRTREMSTRNFSVLPNPLTQETAVQFTLDQPETAQVQVQDLVGRTVFTLPAQRLGAGQQRLALGAEGKRLSPGVYLVQLTVGQQRLTSRVLVQ
ncbi:T9SS type A sorting domain-containing protein [Hymenobacter sp. 15J16-1T3B]|uniref:M43 family zinc metalloprotease n=1 Tax=Hymenobacter sp. 15J16-1T3B TaxID=2886941 RepID=UPI001D0F60A3|nr:M43 family zinc metalloprotease [Hymenobacter sp. 15J16-1T3B]MCC3158992.1 T9SS type A sorting domain-containing protein [Hymenobacter sp. 15J16-1T3B]